MQLSGVGRRIPDIFRVVPNVEIAAKQYVLIGITGRVKIAPQPDKPVELKLEFVRPQLRAIWNVRIDDANTADGRRDHTLWSILSVAGKSKLHVLDR